MADEATLNDVVSLIGNLTEKLEMTLDRLEGVNTFDRIDRLEEKVSILEHTVSGFGDLRDRMSKVEEALVRNTESLAANTASITAHTESLTKNTEELSKKS